MTFVKYNILFFQAVQNLKPPFKILAFKMRPEFRSLTVNVLRKSENNTKF
jgi:hypothetical protein